MKKPCRHCRRPYEALSEMLPGDPFKEGPWLVLQSG